MSAGPFSRLVKLDRLPAGTLVLEATREECAALAERFGLPAVHALDAEVALVRHGDTIEARGRVKATFEQRCAITDEPFSNRLAEPLAIRFVPAMSPLRDGEEGEFERDEPDEIEYAGTAIDLGEAVAESFGLAIDPYARGPDADAARRAAGLLDETAPRGPFAALAALKAGKGP